MNQGERREKEPSLFEKGHEVHEEQTPNLSLLNRDGSSL
jgi:hypothetical protein